MSLCLALGGKTVSLGFAAFTLAWTHSVEKIAWQEDWRATPAGLELVQARVQGSGAGMEPPAGAVLEAGWWRYRPEVAPVERLVLARSGAAGAWTICGPDACRRLDETAAPGEPAVIAACR